jgi:hypothetical protein
LPRISKERLEFLRWRVQRLGRLPIAATLLVAPELADPFDPGRGRGGAVVEEVGPSGRREGVEALPLAGECVCTIEHYNEPFVDDRVRFDPLDPKTSRHAGQCEHRDGIDLPSAAITGSTADGCQRVDRRVPRLLGMGARRRLHRL